MASDQEMVGVGQADLPQHQLRFVTYGSCKTACWGGEWFFQQSGVAGRKLEMTSLSSCPPAPANLLHAVIRIVQAPASYSKPVTQKKSFRPPFKVRLDFRYKGKLQLPVKVEAIALPEQSVEDLVKQQGDEVLIPAQLSQQNELENASISSCIQTHEGDIDDSIEKMHSEDLEFTELRFSKSSRMSRRWVLFTCRLGQDMLYSLYRLPTIVLSRKTDQFDKACGLLRERNLVASVPCASDYLREPQRWCSSCAANKCQEVATAQQLTGFVSDSSLRPFACHRRIRSEPPNSSFIPRETVQQYILDKYAASCLGRSLMESELSALGMRAGLRTIANCGSGAVDATDEHSWREFQYWFTGCLKALKPVDHLWSVTDVMRICPFTVDRECAEELLQGTPSGTFLLRTCSFDSGSFAISVQRVHQNHLGVPTSEVKHVLVDRLDLQEQALDSWVMRNEWAQYLLDIQTRDYIHKSVAFGPQALGIANSPPDFSSSLYQPVRMLSPSPPLSTTTNIDPGTPTVSVEHTVSEESGVHGASIAVPPNLQPQQHFCHQYQLTSIPPQGLSAPLQEEYLTQNLHSLINASGLTCEQLSLLKSESMMKERMLRKRSSSTSIDTTVCFGDRPSKRRIFGGGSGGFNADPGLLLSMPGLALSQSAELVNDARYNV